MSLPHRIPPPPPLADAGLFRFLTDARGELARLAAADTPPAPQAPVLLNGWGDKGAPYAAAGHFIHLGLVHLAGAVAEGTLGQAAFVLPPGRRPDAVRRFVVEASGAPGAVEVDSGGNVTPVAGNVAGIWLDGITFRAGG